MNKLIINRIKKLLMKEIVTMILNRELWDQILVHQNIYLYHKINLVLR